MEDVHNRSLKKLRQVLTAFAHFFIDDKVFLVAFCIAVLAVVFGKAHFTTQFFDWKMLVTVFGLMLVIGGFRNSGLLRFVGETMVGWSKNTRQLVRFTTNLTFFLAIFFTNDLTILTMLPLYLLITKHVKNRKSVYLGAAFIVPACHMGSSLLPFGNPHNLYLYNFFHLAINNLRFFEGTVPLWLSGLIILNLACFLIDKDPVHIETKPKNFNLAEVIIFVSLMLIMVSSVFSLISYWLSAGITVLAVLLYKRELFKIIDYRLLLTFMCFFLIVGNLVEIPAISQFVENVFVGPRGAFLGTVIISQFISNISAAVLMSPFTYYGLPVLIGADVGGIGMLTASMATLIAFKIITSSSKGEIKGFVRYFAMTMAAFLGIFVLIGLIIVTFII